MQFFLYKLIWKEKSIKLCRFIPHKLTFGNFLFIKKSTAKQISNSLKRSFFCKPNKTTPPANSNAPMSNGGHHHHNHHHQHQQRVNQTQSMKPATSSSGTYHKSTKPPNPATTAATTTTTTTTTSHHHHQPPITLLGGLTSPQNYSTDNNSDYNLIYNHQYQQLQQSAGFTNKLNTHQTLNNISTNTNGAATSGGGIPLTSSLPLNPTELLYSNVAPKLAKSPKTKKVVSTSVHNTNGTANGTAILDDNDDDDTFTPIEHHKPIDLTHIL